MSQTSNDRHKGNYFIFVCHTYLITYLVDLPNNSHMFLFRECVWVICKWLLTSYHKCVILQNLFSVWIKFNWLTFQICNRSILYHYTYEISPTIIIRFISFHSEKYDIYNISVLQNINVVTAHRNPDLKLLKNYSILTSKVVTKASSLNRIWRILCFVYAERAV